MEQKENMMNLQEKKLELVQLILNTNRPALLEIVGQLLRQEKEPDWWAELPEAVQEAIEEGGNEAAKGETTPHEEVMREVRLKYGL